MSSAIEVTLVFYVDIMRRTFLYIMIVLFSYFPWLVVGFWFANIKNLNTHKSYLYKIYTINFANIFLYSEQMENLKIYIETSLFVCEQSNIKDAYFHSVHS